MSLADFNLDGLEDVTLANSDGSVTAYAQLRWTSLRLLMN